MKEYARLGIKKPPEDKKCMEKHKATSEKSRRYLAAPKKKTVAETPKQSGITRETNIMEIVHEYPEAVPVLIEAGLHCIGCQLSMYDTLETGCAIHGMDKETVDRIVVEMNERVKNFRK